VVETLAPDIEAQRDALADRLFGSANATFDLAAIYLGDRLGLYRALADGGAATSAELAARTGLNERYVREWLEQQAVTAILLTGSDDDAASRRYSLPPAHREVLVDELSLAHMTPFIRAIVGSMGMLPGIMHAFAEGGGVGWAEYGDDLRDGQAAGNRPQFHHLMADWLGQIPDVHERLSSPGTRVADVACGQGWSTIAIARAYPNARVDGMDLDAPAIEQARRNAAGTDVADRVTFHSRDAADPALEGVFDLVTIFEAVHDLSQPVAVLEAARRLLAPGGTMIVMDERVAEQFTAPGDDIERFMYGFSLLVCLPNSMAETPSVGTGTAMRPDTLRRYALDAGFGAMTVLPIEHGSFRFYRLDPEIAR
jgi:SAM-dependent methyltransferase